MSHPGLVHTCPLINLEAPYVLLPGMTMAISMIDRPDVVEALSQAYTSPSNRRRSFEKLVACIPEGSKIGTLAKVVGIQGCQQVDLRLQVKGLCRIRVEEDLDFTQLEHRTDVRDTDALRDRLQQLQLQTGRFVEISYTAASLARDVSEAITPLLHSRDRLVREHQRLTGPLADALTSIVSCSFDEKKQVLATLDAELRLDLILNIIYQQVTSLCGGVEDTSKDVWQDIISNESRSPVVLGPRIEDCKQDVELRCRL